MGQKPMPFPTQKTLFTMNLKEYQITVLCPHSHIGFLEADLFQCYYVNDRLQNLMKGR